jgi:hypothetical protein
MKKHVLRLMALLIFASVTVTGISGCSVEYREHHHHMNNDHEHDRDNNHHDHDYRGY